MTEDEKKLLQAKHRLEEAEQNMNIKGSVNSTEGRVTKIGVGIKVVLY